MSAPIEDISKFLNGSLDEKKTDALVNWREASPENEHYFQEIAYLWNSSSHSVKEESIHLTIDTEAALAQVNSSIEATKVVKLKPRFNLLAIASGFALLIAAIFAIQQFQTLSPNVEIFADATTGKKVTLPDASSIWLEPLAKVSYDPRFSDGRHIKVEGEVFVDVVRNEASPFTVQSPNLGVRVLGTSFVIRDSKNEKTSHVTVVSGKVEVSHKNSNQSVELTKDMTAVFDTPSSRLTIADSPLGINHLFAATKQFRFSNSNLSDVFSQLEMLTDTQIELDNFALSSCPFTGQFSTNNVEEILQRIQPIYNFTMHMKEGKFIISGGSCN